MFVYASVVQADCVYRGMSASLLYYNSCTITLVLEHLYYNTCTVTLAQRIRVLCEAMTCLLCMQALCKQTVVALMCLQACTVTLVQRVACA